MQRILHLLHNSKLTNTTKWSRSRKIKTIQINAKQNARTRKKHRNMHRRKRPTKQYDGEKIMYKLVKHDFHHYKIINKTTGECYGPFTRFEKYQLEKLIECLNNKEKQLQPIHSICEKYRIPIEDLSGVLDEYIVRDNDGYYGYSMCNDCSNNCNDHVLDCENFHSQYSP